MLFGADHVSSKAIVASLIIEHTVNFALSGNSHGPCNLFIGFRRERCDEFWGKYVFGPQRKKRGSDTSLLASYALQCDKLCKRNVMLDPYYSDGKPLYNLKAYFICVYFSLSYILQSLLMLT